MDCKAIDYRNIPVQADIISGIIALNPDANNCFHELERLVHSDQGVASLVLRVVNSPFYTRGQRIATVPLAISVLGFNVVRSLALLAFTRSLFSRTQDPLFLQHIWLHSLLTAVAGQRICADLGAAGQRDEALVAGLMHDIGKLLMFTHDPAGYTRVIQQVLATGQSSAEVEQALLGVDHCAVGVEAARQWNLPERFADYMGTDLAGHRAEYAEDPVRLSLALANTLVCQLGWGGNPEPDLPRREAALRAFGVEEHLCQRWLTEEFAQALQNNELYLMCQS